VTGQPVSLFSFPEKVKSTGDNAVMSEQLRERTTNLIEPENLTQGERDELIALGVLSTFGEIQTAQTTAPGDGLESIPRSGIENHSVLNEACEYGSAFSRGLRLELDKYLLLLISGTASVDEQGDTIHRGDIRAQCWRTYRNITALLESEGATWKDVVKTTCYLRDIERDYEDFNAVRTAFFKWNELDPLPASVGIQARLCREDLLVEIEAVAILRKTR
jgi:enamine deaminase RidA (YjgF/YER057c/UK114 family)